MMVTFVSQCQKNALKKTRRVLDAFADRIGDNTWQTVITEDGLAAVKKMLRQTASKSTAVSCHWIRSRSRSELLWTVGNKNQFDEVGRVPVNSTTNELNNTESAWHTLPMIRFAAEMAALWHDFGKASARFQNKLLRKEKIADPYRHEWVSLRLFQAFVGQAEDIVWLKRLKQSSIENGWWKQFLICDGIDSAVDKPFERLAPFARLVAWLVLSHHRLPLPAQVGDVSDAAISSVWTELDASWAHSRQDADGHVKKECWLFDKGLPTQSISWKSRAYKLATKILLNQATFADASLENPFVAHLSRLSLIAGDHLYSSEEGIRENGDTTYSVYANTRKDGSLKQRLDEHLVGVAKYSKKIAGTLSELNKSLPSLSNRREFLRKTTAHHFLWQNNACDLATQVRKRSKQNGFFGINMASTGCGKTLANARIMYGLSEPTDGARFCVALGLRTLTLQTGDAYRERLLLNDKDIAVMIGSSAVRTLHEHASREQQELENPNVLGSESAEKLVEETINVQYKGDVPEGKLFDLLGRQSRLARLISAPVLVATIDHLMPASETMRGGHQIAPMLRLMTSDLVLDEPDDFDIEDLPALSRMVYFAGMLGSRVLLSSATLPPAIVQGLFAAYSAGRAIYQQNVGSNNANQNICCAWFDEFNTKQADCSTERDFEQAHRSYVESRAANLIKHASGVKRKARIQTLEIDATQRKEKIIRAYANALPAIFHSLHESHHSTDSKTNKRVSFGLIRMANINPLFQVAKTLYAVVPPEGSRVHICTYHSRFPLIVRSGIEKNLDRILNRSDENAVFDDPLIRSALEQGDEQDHLFLVLASPVAEVGRDHDYDWAIVEPSSMRSIIQVAGRVRRHRESSITEPNVVLLDKNIRTLINNNDSEPAFKWPGFESSKSYGQEKRYLLKKHALTQTVLLEDIEPLNAVPRIIERTDKPRERLLDLEHARLRTLLIDQQVDEYFIRRFWSSPTQYTGIEQDIKEFRDSSPEIEFYTLPEDDKVRHFRKEHKAADSDQSGSFTKLNLQTADCVQPWAIADLGASLDQLRSEGWASGDFSARDFAVLHVPKYWENKLIHWHPLLGYSNSWDS